MRLKLRDLANHRALLIAVIVCCLYTLGHHSDKYFGYTNGKYGSHNRTPIAADGTGYYYFLTGLFIYPDYESFQDTVTQKYPDYHFQSMLSYSEPDGRMYSKFFTGTPLLQMPFFLAAHAVQKIRGVPADGYSFEYQVAISLAGLFYWLLGIVAFVKVLRAWGLRNFYIGIGVIVVTFGTNLSYYTAIESSISHVYSFCAVNWFLWFAIRWARTGSMKYFFLFALLLGLIFILRPVNILVVFILPFCFEALQGFREALSRFKDRWSALFPAALLFLLPIGIHIILHYAVNGHLVLNGYSDEGFDYLWAPKVADVLFSYRKGLFTYAPVLFLFFPGIVFLFFRKRYLAAGIVFTLAVLTWIIASWWCWYYGGTLGMRTYIEFLILLIFPVLYLLQEVRWPVKVLTGAACIVGIWMYSTYEYQYTHAILHYSEMNRARFWKVFMKKDFRFEWVFYHEDVVLPAGEPHNVERYFYDPGTKRWEQRAKPTAILAYTGTPDLARWEGPANLQQMKDYYLVLKGEARISDERSLLPVGLEYRKNDSLVRSESVLPGADVLIFNKFTPVEAVFHFKADTSAFDRYTLVVRGQYPGDAYRKLELEVFTY